MFSAFYILHKKRLSIIVHCELCIVNWNIHLTKIELELNRDVALLLFGNLDENIRAIEELSGVSIKASSKGIELASHKDVEQSSEDFGAVKALIYKLVQLVENKVIINPNIIAQVWQNIISGQNFDASHFASNIVTHTHKGKKIVAKSLGQSKYIDAIKSNTLIFGIGPAGTGKTYLAVAMAVNALKKKEIHKIILTRPAIEAGEKLGFLPGDLQQKVDPYLRPLYDALEEMTGEESYLKLIEKGQLEIAPLAYMRGRTLSNAFIILDEAQNATDSQLKMFLTRFGEGSKVVVTGDMTQVDLPQNITSGLVVATKILRNIPDIAIIELQAADIIRHPLVQKIVTAYSHHTENINKSSY